MRLLFLHFCHYSYCLHLYIYYIYHISLLHFRLIEFIFYLQARSVMSNDSSSQPIIRQHYIQGNSQPSTSVFNQEVVLQPPPEATNKQQQKKKSHGNRPMQRYRAKLRRQGLSDAEIAAMIESQQVHVDVSSSTAAAAQGQEPMATMHEDATERVIEACNQVAKSMDLLKIYFSLVY